MPLRAESLTKCWSTTHLPILPFLAPRIFAPWLYQGRRAFGSQGVVADNPTAQDVRKDASPRPLRPKPKASLSPAKKPQPFQRRPKLPPTYDLSIDTYKTLPNGATKRVLIKHANPIVRHCKSSSPQYILKSNYGFRVQVWPRRRKFIKTKASSRAVRKEAPIRKMLRPLRRRRTKAKSKHLGILSIKGMNISYKYNAQRTTRSTAKKMETGVSAAGISSERSRRFWALSAPRAARRRLSRVRVFYAIQARKNHLGGSAFHTLKSEWRQAWHKRFSLIDPKHVGFMDSWRGTSYKFRRRPLHKMTLPNKFKHLLIEHRSSVTLRKTWESIPEKMRLKYWPDLMCTVLRRDPEKALKVLVGTYVQPYPAGYAVGNCIDFLISYYFIPPMSQDASFRRVLGSTAIAGSQIDDEFGLAFNSSAPTTNPVIDKELIEQQRALSLFRSLMSFQAHPGSKPHLSWATAPAPLVTTELFGAVIRVLLKGPPNVRLSQKSFYLLMMTMDLASVKILYHKTKQLNHFWSDDNLFMVADRFAKGKESKLAIEVVHTLQARGTNFNAKRMANCFCALLLSKYRDKESSYSDAMIWNYMTSWGLKPIPRHYNALILNAIERGEHDTPWAIHDAMIEDGVEPNIVTYSILFTHAKSILDEPSLRRVLHLVKEKNVPQNSYLANDHLHSIFLTYREQDKSSNIGHNDDNPGLRLRPTVFELMLPIYCQYFEGHALAFGIRSFTSVYPQLDQPLSGKMEPTEFTLSIMFTAYLYGLRYSSQVLDAYNAFRRTLSRNDMPHTVARLHIVEIYNAFIMAFGRYPATLDQCPKVIEDMLTTSKIGSAGLSHLAREFDSDMPVSEDWHINLVPDAYTWTTLLTVYMSHKQANAARRVVDIMVEQGVKPVDVTWGSMAIGYSRMQNIPGTLDAVNKLTAITSDDNPVAIHALGKIKNTRALYVEVEEMQRKNQETAAITDAKPTKTPTQIADSESGERILRLQKAIMNIKRTPWKPREYWESSFNEEEEEAELGLLDEATGIDKEVETDAVREAPTEPAPIRHNLSRHDRMRSLQSY